MPATLTTKLRLAISALLQNTVGLASVPATLSKDLFMNLVNGTGAGQADRVFSETRTIAASGNFDYDLTGTLTDVYGQTLAMARVKAIIIIASAANVNDVVLGGAAANQFAGPFGAVAHTIKVRPGGWLVLATPDATGWPIVAGTGDLLRVANGGAGSGVTYDIVLLGASQ